MNEIVEFLTCAVMLLCSLVITGQWARYGLWELGIARPLNAKPVIASFIGMTSFIIAGLAQRKFGLKFSFLTEENIWQASLVFLGIPLLWLFFVRYAIMPKGQFDYNRAIARTKFWSLSHFKPGEKLKENGELLKNFSMAIQALQFFKNAIKSQEKGAFAAVPMEPKIISLSHVAISERNTVTCSCPRCLASIEVPSCAPLGATGHCTNCGRVITAKTIGNLLYVNCRGGAIISHAITLRSKENIATAYEEMAFLYRMMNRFDDANEFLDRALSITFDILKADPENYEYLKLKALILFRQAEIYHVQGLSVNAKELYNECLLLDEKIGTPQEEIQLTKNLLEKL
jgi:tetratricopeptide (TPR) repeat protein